MYRLGRCYYRLCQTRVGHGLCRGALRFLRRAGLFRRFHMALDALELDHRSLAGLMRLWTRVPWAAGDGMMSLEQRLGVYRLAVSGSGYGDVVELGAWIGLTTTYLATACRVRGEGIVHAVDTFEGTKEYDTRYPSVARYDGNTLEAFCDQIERAGVDDLVKPHVGLTNEVVREYRGRPIRFLLIDADHSYEGVRADFRLWSPLVMPGGLVVFDDYLMPEVARFVDEEVGADRRFEIAPGRIVPNLMAVTKKTVLAAASQPGLRRSPAAEVVEAEVALG